MPLIDYLLLTPLDEEWRTVCSVLCPAHDEIEEKSVEAITYYLWNQPVASPNARGEYLIAAASMAARTPGQAWAGVFTSQAVSFWRPKRSVLIGIAGSIEPDLVRLGDVIVADAIWGYEVEDAQEPDFGLRKTFNPIGALELDRIRAFKANALVLQAWQQECREAATALGLGELQHAPMLHIDAIASGNKVVKSVPFGQKLKRVLDERVRAVEMEARGLHQALYLDAGQTNALIVRGISDYADADKSELEKRSNDNWRTFAAGNAARLVKAFWRRGPTVPLSPTYQLNLERGPFTRFRQPNVPEIDFKHTGAHDLAFPVLLDRGSPTPELALVITAVTRAGARATGFQGLCVTQTPQREVIHGREDEPGRMEIFLPKSEWGLRVELLLSFPSSITEVEISCKDLFGRLVTARVNP